MAADRDDDESQRPENRGETGEPVGPGPGVRTAAGRFAPGSTGNAGGRPKTAKDFRDDARAMSTLVLKKLYSIALSGNGNPSVRAAEIILERAWGRPALEVSGPKGGPIDMRFHGQVRSAIEELIAQSVLKGERPPDGDEPNN